MAIIIAAAVAAALIVFCFLCYKKAPPTQAIVVTGLGLARPKVVCGRGVFVLPVVQRADRLNMRLLKIDVKTPETGVKTKEGVSLWLDSVVTVQVYSENSTVSDDEVRAAGYDDIKKYINSRQQSAISNFLGMDEAHINEKINDVLQGNLREIVSEMTVDQILTNRKQMAVSVVENARPDLAKMGLEVVTFNVQDVKDAVDAMGHNHGVIEAIGVEQEELVKKRASIAKAEAERDVSCAKAAAAMAANEKEIEAQTAIAKRNNELQLAKSKLKAEADKAAADAQAAGMIQTNLRAREVKESEADAEIAKQKKMVDLAAQEAEVQQRKLDAEVRKQADAELYRRQKEAEAQKYEAERAAEAARQAVVSPLLETTINGAKGVLLNITGGADLGIQELSEAASIIQEYADPEANIIMGAGIDEDMGDGVRITVIATGFDTPGARSQQSQHPTAAVNAVQNSQPPRRPTIRDVKDQESSWNGANVKFWERERTRTPQYSSPLPEGEEVTPHFTMDDLPKADKTRGNNNTNNLNVPAFLRRND